MHLTFQPGKAAKLNAVYHFTFTGKEQQQATVTIRDGTLQVQDGHHGEADLRVTADSETWLGFLAKERSLLWALLRQANPHQGVAEAAGGLWQVLSVVSSHDKAPVRKHSTAGVWQFGHECNSKPLYGVSR